VLDKTVNAVTGEIIGFRRDRLHCGLQRAVAAHGRKSSHAVEEHGRQLQRVGRAMGKAAAAYCASISGPTGGQKEGMLPGQVYK
jgi:hypothetical protein